MRIEEKSPYDPDLLDTVTVRLPRSLVVECRIIAARVGFNRPVWRVIADAVCEAVPVYRDEKPEIPKPRCLKEDRQTIVKIPREAHRVAKVVAAESSRRQGRHVAMWHVLADAIARLLARLESEGIGDL